MKISRIFFFQFFRKNFVKFFCNIVFVKKLNFKMFFRKEFFSGTLFRKFSFHEKICFWNFLILNFFFNRNHVRILIFFEKNVSCKFYAFPEKTFGKTNSYRSFFFEKKFKTNFFGFFVPFDALVHY